MWVAAERPPRTRAARLFVFSRTRVILIKTSHSVQNLSREDGGVFQQAASRSDRSQFPIYDPCGRAPHQWLKPGIRHKFRKDAHNPDALTINSLMLASSGIGMRLR